MPPVVRVLKSADDRRGCADSARQLRLRQTGPLAQGMDLARDRGVGALLFEDSEALRTPFEISASENLHGVAGCSSLFCWHASSLNVGVRVWVAFKSPLALDCTVNSTGGTTRCFTMP